jgi:hypothetical protein
VAGIILRPTGAGAYGGGTYDIIGPTGSSLGYSIVAARAGDSIELFDTGSGSESGSDARPSVFGCGVNDQPGDAQLGWYPCDTFVCGAFRSGC